MLREGNHVCCNGSWVMADRIGMGLWEMNEDLVTEVFQLLGIAHASIDYMPLRGHVSW